MVSIFIYRKNLKPDIFIECDDLQFAEFITKIYSPFAMPMSNDAILEPENDCLKIKVIDSGNGRFTITWPDNRKDVQKDDAAQLVENIIYEMAYPADGILPLHGAAVHIGNDIFLLLGHTTSGKSTLCSYLIGQGFGYVTDDIIFIEKTNLGVYPFRKNISLRQGGLDILTDIYGIRFEDMQHVKWGEIERYCYTAPSSCDDEPICKNINILFIKRTTNVNSSNNLSMPASFVELTKSLYTYKKSSPEDMRFLCGLLQKSRCLSMEYCKMEYMKEKMLDICGSSLR